MRAAVAEPEKCSGIGQHLADRLVIVPGVAGHREKQEIAGIGGQVVIGDLVRRAAFAGRYRGDAGFGARLVIGRVAHRVHAVPLPGGKLDERPEAAQQSRRRPVVEDRAAHRRIAQPRETLA